MGITSSTENIKNIPKDNMHVSVVLILMSHKHEIEYTLSNTELSFVFSILILVTLIYFIQRDMHFDLNYSSIY